MLTKHPTSDM